MILVFSLHSFADVITNSSSEIFVCNTPRLEDDIKAMLQSVAVAAMGTEVDRYSSSRGWHGLGTVKVHRGVAGLYRALLDVGQDYWDRGTLQAIVGRFAAIPQEAYPDVRSYWDSDFYKMTKGEDFHDRWRRIDAERRATKRRVKDFLRAHAADLQKACGTVVVMRGADENSVPMSVCDAIEERLGGVWVHQG